MIKSFAKLCSLIFICICFTSCESNSEPDDSDSEPFVCTNRDEWINEFGDDRLLEKVLHTTIPKLPMNIYPTPENQELYLGQYKGYELFVAPFTASPSFYKVNDYNFEQLIYCVKQENSKMLNAMYSEYLTQNNFVDLFSQNVFDADDLEQIYCSYIVRLNEKHRDDKSDSEIIFKYLSEPDTSPLPVYRQEDAINDIEYLDYSVCDFSDKPLETVLNVSSSNSSKAFLILWKCIELGTFSGYTLYFSVKPSTSYGFLHIDSINRYFDNKFYFNSKEKTGGIFCIKDNVLYTQKTCLDLYRNNELIDNDIEIMARKIFSYYFDCAENKEVFKQNYISEWNRNYRNPKYIN